METTPCRKTGFVSALFILALLAGPPVTRAQGLAEPGVIFGKPFWKQWSDGKAELATYDLTIPRYGQIRKGVAITIVIPETFSDTLRVKADRGKHPKSDTYPVLKLNLIEDFPTGIYDYNLMTSVFTTMSAVKGRPAGSATKVSFSAQEWCGHAWTQFLFDTTGVRYTGHSYFDGEADDAMTLDYPADGISEDALLLWARGWAAPLVPPGEKQEVSLLTSARFSRFGHGKPKWKRAVLAHSAKSREVVVPAGTFQTDFFTVSVKDGRRWSFYVEQGGMRRVVKWASGKGEVGELVSSERHKYWEMNGRRFVPALDGLGLSARPPRTP